MQTILAVGNDHGSLLSRAEILRRCSGKAVVGVANATEAIGLLKTQLFDLVVLCHPLDMEELVPIVALAHNQGVEVKLLKTVPSKSQSNYESVTRDEIAPNDAQILMAEIDNLLNRQPRKRTIQ